MRILPLAAFIVSVLAASLPMTLPVHAGTAIQRCEADDGSLVYTDKACSAFGAASRPMPGELLNRIARDETNAAMTPANNLDAGPANTVAVARRPAGAGCARSPTQLAMDLRGSLAMGDVNRLAESYHWVGLTQAQSKPIMQKLERLTRQPLLDAHYFDARIGPGGTLLADAGPGKSAASVMQLVFDAPSRQVLDLDVQQYAGCYFVRF